MPPCLVIVQNAFCSPSLSRDFSIKERTGSEILVRDQFGIVKVWMGDQRVNKQKPVGDFATEQLNRNLNSLLYQLEYCHIPRLASKGN